MSEKQDILGKVLDLAAMVDYQQASVVSRTLISKDAGTVTLFAFSQGQSLSEHTAPFDAMVYIIDGKAEVMISGESFNLTKGQMVIMPANKPHTVKAVVDFKMALVMIKS